tara:strand:- start:8199 stop:8546 length:348 start_codon:yes stop_codon:yes gene_type:complete
MRFIAFFAFLFAILFASCKKEEIPELVEPILQEETYSSIKIILESSCLGSHSPDQNTYIIDMTNYQSKKKYLDGTNTMIDRLNSDDEFYRMPPYCNLLDVDKQKLIDWINNGYFE